MPAPPATVRTTKATRTIITSTPKYSARPIATPVSMRSWLGLRSAVRSGSAWYLGPVREWGSKWPVVEASGFTVVVFMALACLRDLGQHIGKIPGAPLIPAGPGSAAGHRRAAGRQVPPPPGPPDRHRRPHRGPPPGLGSALDHPRAAGPA